MQHIINKHINTPRWVSELPIRSTQRESALFAWLGDDRIAELTQNEHRITLAERILDKGLFGIYYIQAIFSTTIDLDAYLVIINSSGEIVDNFIFNINDVDSTAQKAKNAIINREEIIIRDVLINIEQEYYLDNVKKLIQIFKILELNPFNQELSHSEIAFIKFIFDFGFEYFTTNEVFDLKKINFVMERLNNPWSEIEIKTILQLVDKYEIVKKIRNIESVFEKLGGVRNVGLILHRGKIHKDLFAVAMRDNFNQKQLLQSIDETKQIINRLNL